MPRFLRVAAASGWCASVARSPWRTTRKAPAGHHRVVLESSRASRSTQRTLSAARRLAGLRDQTVGRITPAMIVTSARAMSKRPHRSTREAPKKQSGRIPWPAASRNVASHGVFAHFQCPGVGRMRHRPVRPSVRQEAPAVEVPRITIGSRANPEGSATIRVDTAGVTEHRVWHLESLRHGGSSEPGHQGWHSLGRVVGT